MKKWFVFVLGVITGLLIAYAFPLHETTPEESQIEGLELFDQPEAFTGYKDFKIKKLVDKGCALAVANWPLGPTVLIIPDEGQNFYDDQKIVLDQNGSALRVGTYKYEHLLRENTVPAIRIIDEEDSSGAMGAKTKNGMTLFDNPGECVSRKDFEVQQVLESGDAIAKEIRDSFNGSIYTSDLEVLILAKDGKSYFNKQIIKVPKGKCARQVGTYKCKIYEIDRDIPGNFKVIPIVEIM